MPAKPPLKGASVAKKNMIRRNFLFNPNFSTHFTQEKFARRADRLNPDGFNRACRGNLIRVSGWLARFGIKISILFLVVIFAVIATKMVAVPIFLQKIWYSPHFSQNWDTCLPAGRATHFSLRPSAFVTADNKHSAEDTIAIQIRSLVKQLCAAGLDPKINGVSLVKHENHRDLLRRIQRFSILRDRRQIKLLLEARLCLINNANPPQSLGMSPEAIMAVYNAIFEQDKFLERFTPDKPFKIVLFRGGRGAREMTTRLISDIPNIEVSIVIAATDDGRQWSIPAQDFNATGIPDCGKSLLDLATDKKVADFLSWRIKGNKEDVAKAFGYLINKISGLPYTGEYNAEYQRISRLAEPAYKRFTDIEDSGKQVKLIEYLRTFRDIYQAKTKRFTFSEIPMRSMAIIGAAWRLGSADNPAWQAASDKIGELLGCGKNRVLFPTQKRQHLISLTKDGRIYFTETGLNEDPRKDDFMGIWLMDKMPDINDSEDPVLRDLADAGIKLRPFTVDTNIRGRRIPGELIKEVEMTSRQIQGRHNTQEFRRRVAKAAEILSKYSTTAVPNPVQASLNALDAIHSADVIVYCTTTMESNMGCALIVPGIGNAIRQSHALKINFSNATIENDPPGTTAMDMIERLFRYVTGQQWYKTETVAWGEAGLFLNYVIGIGEQYPELDMGKIYIPFDSDNIRETTGKTVKPVALDIESAVPKVVLGWDYRNYREEYGFYDPDVQKETLVALYAIEQQGFSVVDGKLAVSSENIAAGKQLQRNAERYILTQALRPAAFAVSMTKNSIQQNPLSSLSNPAVRDYVLHSLKFSYGQFKTDADTPELILRILSEQYRESPWDAIDSISRILTKDRGFKAAYNRYKGQKKAEHTLSVIAGYLTGSSVVVDIGCGNNMLAKAIYETAGVSKVIGTDVVKGGYQNRGAAVEFRLQKSPTQIPVEDKSADVVLLTSMIHYLDDSEISKILSEARRILKPGGRMIIIEDAYSEALPTEGTLAKEFSRLGEIEKYAAMALIEYIGGKIIPEAITGARVSYSSPFNFKTLEQWSGILSENGFAVKTSKYLGFPMGRFHLNPQSILVAEKPETGLKAFPTTDAREGRDIGPGAIVPANGLAPDARIRMSGNGYGVQIFFNPDDEYAISITPLWEMAGWQMRFAQLAPGAVVGLDKTTGENYVKVITGKLSNINRDAFTAAKQTRSTRVDEDFIQADDEGAIVAIMTRTKAAPDIISDMKQVKITGPAQEVLSWVNCETYNWGPQFKDLPFYNLRGMQIINGKGKRVCNVQFWTAGKGVNCADHDHSDLNLDNTFCEIHLGMSNGTGKGGMVYYDADEREVFLPLQTGEEHGPFWDFNVPTGKPVVAHAGAVKYGPHRWQGGEQRVTPGEQDAFDLWAAFEIVPKEAMVKPAQEYVDVLDPDTGELTGQAVPIGVAHKQGFWHGVSHVIVFTKDGKIILQVRGASMNASANKKDISVAGHNSAGQTRRETGVRELKEELAVEATPEQLHQIGHQYKKIAIADKKEAGHYDENGVFIYHSNKTPNNEFNSLYYIVVDKTVDEINEAIRKQAETSTDEAKNEVARVEEIAIEDVLRDIDDPVARKAYASGIVQYMLHKEARAALAGISLSLRQKAPSQAAQSAGKATMRQEQFYAELLSAA